MQSHQSSDSASTAATFTITADWLTRHATRGCGWTDAQMRALGLNRQYTGWKQGVIGTRISRAQRLAFELGSKKAKQSTLQNDAALDATIAQLSAYARLVAVRVRGNYDAQAAGEFIAWLGEAIGRLAPGVASRMELRRLTSEAEAFASEFDARVARQALG